MKCIWCTARWYIRNIVSFHLKSLFTKLSNRNTPFVYCSTYCVALHTVFYFAEFGTNGTIKWVSDCMRLKRERGREGERKKRVKMCPDRSVVYSVVHIKMLELVRTKFYVYIFTFGWRSRATRRSIEWGKVKPEQIDCMSCVCVWVRKEKERERKKRTNDPREWTTKICKSNVFQLHRISWIPHCECEWKKSGILVGNFRCIRRQSKSFWTTEEKSDRKMCG